MLKVVRQAKWCMMIAKKDKCVQFYKGDLVNESTNGVAL